MAGPPRCWDGSWRRSVQGSVASGDGRDVGGLVALGALGHRELDALVFGQRLEAVALDLAEMGKQVLAAVVGGDEAVALGLVEPLHGAGLDRHVIDAFLKVPRGNRPARCETPRR